MPLLPSLFPNHTFVCTKVSTKKRYKQEIKLSILYVKLPVH